MTTPQPLVLNNRRDNNRMTSQWARGGGAVCFRDTKLFAAVSASVVAVDGCAA